MRTIRLKGIILPALMLLASFYSCSNENIINDESSEKSTLVLSLNLNDASSRSAAYITTDPTDKEKNIGGVVVGIFDSDGKVKTITKFDSYTNNVTVQTKNLSTSDKVVVAVNPPSSTLFANVQTISEFKAKTCTAEEALSKVGGTENYSFPMIGEANPSSSDGVWTASVTVTRLVSKITLSSLKVEFDESGAYNGASFTPEEVYLLNVPEKVGFNVTSFETNTTFLTGNSKTEGFKDYLGTGALTAEELKNDNASYSNSLYFYTLPNNNASNITKLVIKGLFKSSSIDTGSDYYYPIIINKNDDGAAVDGGTVSTIGYNKNYQLGVIIKTKGVAGESDPLDQAKATVTVTVANFDECSQTNTFE